VVRAPSRAQDSTLDRIVAGKVINQSVADDPAYFGGPSKGGQVGCRP